MEDYEKFTAPRLDEELHQGVEAPMTFGNDPLDGMPTQSPAAGEDHAPSLSEDTLVCMADKRSFVIRNSDGTIWATFTPAEVSRFPNGEYYVEGDVLKERTGEDFAISWAGNIGQVIETRRGILRHEVVRVEPVRPQCLHYLRMKTDTSADRRSRFIARSCMAQYDASGEYYSLRDSLIEACSIRSPRHLSSEQALDDFDAARIAMGRERAALGSFDPEAELEAEAEVERARSNLGILT